MVRRVGDADGVSDPSPPIPPVVVRHLARALRGVVALVFTMPDDGWTLPTPCEGWNVRDVANHVATVTEKFTRFAAGEDGLLREDGRDWLGDRPDEGLLRVVSESSATWRDHPEALERTCHLPFGDFDGATAAAINLFDAVVHGWDVATATDQHWFSPGARAVDLSLEIAELLVTPAARASGQFGPPASAKPTPFGRLLGLTGRSSAR